MCGICGCTEEHTHDHHHPHHDDHVVIVEQDILAKNQRDAALNEKLFQSKKIRAYNLMSSPGSGKTTLLAKTFSDLGKNLNAAVIVGDQQTDLDAQSLKAHGAQAFQINTGKVCHLDAHRIGHALEEMELQEGMTLFIENIGNLVCPALFSLGETKKIVILSVTEGENKPLKYPEMFRQADLLLITKTDLLPYVPFDLEQCIAFAKRINPQLTIIPLSVMNGDGLKQWYQWLS